MVPAAGGFAYWLAIYLAKVNSELNKYTGRVWWTGTKGIHLKGMPMGKNMVGKVPHDVATRMGLPNQESYTFHSYRRTSATSAANRGMTADQMQGFFGWKNSSVCQEYISSSRSAVMHAANTPGSFDLGDVEVDDEEELPVEMVQEEEEDLSGLVLEEDPDMHVAGRITYQAFSTSGNIQQAIQSAISSIPSLQGAYVSVKVWQNNHGSVSF